MVTSLWLCFETHPKILPHESVRTELVFLLLGISKLAQEYGCTTSEVDGGEDARDWAALEVAWAVAVGGEEDSVVCHVTA